MSQMDTDIPEFRIRALCQIPQMNTDIPEVRICALCVICGYFLRTLSFLWSIRGQMTVCSTPSFSSTSFGGPSKLARGTLPT